MKEALRSTAEASDVGGTSVSGWFGRGEVAPTWAVGEPDSLNYRSAGKAEEGSAMKAMKTLVACVVVLMLAGTVVGCAKTIVGTVTAVDANRTVSNAGMVSTGVATVTLEDGTQVKVQMDDAAMREFDKAGSSKMKLTKTSSGEYVFAGMQ